MLMGEIFVKEVSVSHCNFKLDWPLFALENITMNEYEYQGKHILVLKTLQKTCKSNLDDFGFL